MIGAVGRVMWHRISASARCESAHDDLWMCRSGLATADHSRSMVTLPSTRRGACRHRRVGAAWPLVLLVPSARHDLRALRAAERSGCWLHQLPGTGADLVGLGGVLARVSRRRPRRRTVRTRGHARMVLGRVCGRARQGARRPSRAPQQPLRPTGGAHRSSRHGTAALLCCG